MSLWSTALHWCFSPGCSNIQVTHGHGLYAMQQMLVMKLPADYSLKCEVLSMLGRSHKHLGETAYQRQAYEKGLEVCAAGLATKDRSGQFTQQHYRVGEGTDKRSETDVINSRMLN